MIRILFISLISGEIIRIDEKALARIFSEFSLPYPNIYGPGLSLLFREKINIYGVSILEENKDNFAILRLIPPGQIKNIYFCIGNEDEFKNWNPPS
jgi:hypothetical protein